MKKNSSIKSAWQFIKLVDKFLIVIIVILYIIISATLFISEAQNEVKGAIDIVVRTAIASIFGYFISSNFIKNEGNFNSEDNTINSLNKMEINNASTNNENVVSIIGFTVGDELENSDNNTLVDQNSTKTLYTVNENSNKLPKNNLQIMIIGIICLCSLIILIVVRFFIEVEMAHLSTLSLFRDIICGSIGFLIGTPTDLKSK